MATSSCVGADDCSATGGGLSGGDVTCPTGGRLCGPPVAPASTADLLIGLSDFSRMLRVRSVSDLSQLHIYIPWLRRP